MPFSPRAKQKKVIDYVGGKMGVSAVPGSGKTRTLSYLAAKLVAEGSLRDDQEVLVVTLTNSAADNFSRQVAEFVRERGLLVGVGYRVRTLHGLANDILRERADLVGLGIPFPIIEQSESDRMLDEAAEFWVRRNPRWFMPYVLAGVEDVNSKQAGSWRYLLSTVCRAYVRQAKDLQLSPEELRSRLLRAGQDFVLAGAATEVFAQYQSALIYRSAVDFGDLIRFALDVLTIDGDYLRQVRYRWPFVLEDEAQDSSDLQERLLRLITAEHGNWVRVGDPNQAIYETFTTASPEHLRRFLREKDVVKRDLPNSGRSTKSIIDLANRLAEWSRKEHPSAAIRKLATLAPPKIIATPKGDPQPNPLDNPSRIHLDPAPRTPDEEKKRVIDSVQSALAGDTKVTIAVLVPRNDTGAKYVERLQALRIPYFELLRTPSSARASVEHMGAMLYVIARPHESKWLENAFMAWFDVRHPDHEESPVARKTAQGLVRGNTEDFLFTVQGRDWTDSFPAAVEASRNAPQVVAALEDFRTSMSRWIEGTVLPADQLILTVGQDLFQNPYDIAVTYALAVLMRRETDLDPTLRLQDLILRVEEIIANKRPIYGISGEETDFNPDDHPGTVTVSTMHRAKGLEWDRVYLTSVNNYDFPSNQPQDTYVGEPVFVRDHLNLEAEVLEQLKVLADPGRTYKEGVATQRARLEYVAERLRLLYVGITRARKELIILTNDGKGQAYPSAALVALESWWRAHRGT